MNNLEVYQVTHDDAKRILGSQFISKQRRLPMTNTSIVVKEALASVPAGEFVDTTWITEAARKVGLKEKQCNNATTLLLVAGYIQKTNIKAVYRVTDKHLTELR